MNKLFIHVGLIFLFFSCQKEESYTAYNHFNNNVWREDSVVTIQLPQLKNDTIKTGKYTALLELVYTKESELQNIHIGYFYNNKDEEGSTLEKEITLRNNYGQIQGAGIFNYFQINDTLIKNIELNKNDSISFGMMHLHSQDINGINKIGIKLIRSN